MQFIRTIWNMIILDSFNPKVFKFLYNECPIYITPTLRMECATYYYGRITGDPLKIEIGTFSKQDHKITALLHEVGHLKDSIKNKHRHYYYSTTHMNKTEKSAWKNALRFSKKYGISIDANYAADCLGTYGTEYACLNNLKKES